MLFFLPTTACNSNLFRTFAHNMKQTVIEDKLFEVEPFEEDGSVLIAAEGSWRGMADELEELHYLKGAQFINQLKLIICYGEFNTVEGETNIFSAISEKSDDFENLLYLIPRESERQISFSNVKAFIRCLTLKPLQERILLVTDLWNPLVRPIMFC